MAQWKEVPPHTFGSFLRKQRKLHTVYSVDIKIGKARVFFIGAEHYADPKAHWIAKMETVGNTAFHYIAEQV